MKRPKALTRKVMRLSYCSLMDCTISLRRKKMWGYKLFNEMFREYSDNSLIYEVFHVGSKRKCRLVQVYKSFTVKMGRSINVLGYMGTNGREVCVKLGWDVKRMSVEISIMLGNFLKDEEKRKRNSSDLREVQRKRRKVK